MNVDVGQIIAGKYELVRLIGKGAMGEVWLATHNSLGGEFAVKLVEPNDDEEAETAGGRFQLEAQIAAKLSRKTRHIVSVSDHGEENGLAYLVMERLEGESLEERTRRVGSLALADVAAVVSQVARALSLAHEESIFHRDLKPANVWLGRDEDGRLLVKLLDFGIARTTKPMRVRSPFATSKDMVLGTPSYMSPEQARGLDTLDFRCDLWALAVVAYEALTTSIPFEGTTVEDIFLSICTFRVVPLLTRRPELPPMAEAFFARAFAPKLEDRFANAASLTEAFERLVSPEDLENALGIPFTPTSARRVEVAVAAQVRGSNPSFASNPNFVPPPPTSSNADSFPQGAPSSPMQMQMRASSPDHDLDNGPSVDPMSIGIVPRRGSGVSWAIGIAGVILLLGVGVLGVITFHGTKPTQATQLETTLTASPPASTPAVPPTTPPPQTVATAPATTTATTAIAPTPTSRGKVPPTLTAGGPLPPHTTTAPTGVVIAPTPPVTAVPAVTPSATTAKSVKKSEVF